MAFGEGRELLITEGKKKILASTRLYQKYETNLSSVCLFPNFFLE